MIRLVYRSDVHLASQAPQSRTDDWAATIVGKLDQVAAIAREVQAQAILDGGDFFHIKSPGRTPHDLVREVAAVHAGYPPVYANIGNHDCKYGDYAFLDESPLGVLFASSVFRRCYDQHEALFEQDGVKVRVVGIPYHGKKYDWNRIRGITKGDEDHLIVMAHLLASPGGGEMFGGEDIVPYSELGGLDPDLWCFLPGTKVLDWSGRQVSIENVQDSWGLMGRNGVVCIEQVHPVRHIDEDVVRFDVEGLPSDLIPGVTLEHPFWVAQKLRCRLPSRSKRRCHRDKPMGAYPCCSCIAKPSVHAGWVKAGQVAAGDFLAIPVPSIPAMTQPSRGLARLLGLYLAEGHLIENRAGEPVAGVVWSFHEDETALQDDVERLVQEHFGLKVKRHFNKAEHYVQVCAYGREVTEFHLANGGRYSARKCLSSWVWGLSGVDRLELLLGWLDGDGHARNPAQYARVKVDVMGATVSADLASQMFLLAVSTGLRPHYTLRPAKDVLFWKGTTREYGSSAKPVHIISFYGDDADLLSKRMGTLPPKRSKTKVAGFFHEGLYYVRVRAVERFHYEGPVYNMRTSTGEYVAGHLLTHNCFGHWHKNQGVQRIGSKTIVNLGSLTRGAMTEDEVSRIPECAVLTCTKTQIQVERRALQVTPADQVFDLVGRTRQEARAMTVDAFVESIQETLAVTATGSLLDQVRALDLPGPVKERVQAYLEAEGAT